MSDQQTSKKIVDVEGAESEIDSLLQEIRAVALRAGLDPAKYMPAVETSDDEFKIGEEVKVIGLFPEADWRVTGIVWRPPLYTLKHGDGNTCTAEGQHLQRTAVKASGGI